MVEGKCSSSPADWLKDALLDKKPRDLNKVVFIHDRAGAGRLPGRNAFADRAQQRLAVGQSGQAVGAQPVGHGGEALRQVADLVFAIDIKNLCQITRRHAVGKRYTFGNRAGNAEGDDRAEKDRQEQGHQAGARRVRRSACAKDL